MWLRSESENSKRKSNGLPPSLRRRECRSRTWARFANCTSKQRASQRELAEGSGRGAGDRKGGSTTQRTETAHAEQLPCSERMQEQNDKKTLAGLFRERELKRKPTTAEPTISPRQESNSQRKPPPPRCSVCSHRFSPDGLYNRSCRGLRSMMEKVLARAADVAISVGGYGSARRIAR